LSDLALTKVVVADQDQYLAAIGQHWSQGHPFYVVGHNAEVFFKVGKQLLVDVFNKGWCCRVFIE
jgi:hypothetical protein